MRMIAAMEEFRRTSKPPKGGGTKKTDQRKDAILGTEEEMRAGYIYIYIYLGERERERENANDMKRTSLAPTRHKQSHDNIIYLCGHNVHIHIYIYI